MNLDHHTFTRIGLALYGPEGHEVPVWQLRMAADLHVAFRVIRRWTNGSFEVPYSVWEELAEFLTASESNIAQLWAKRLKAELARTEAERSEAQWNAIR